MQISGHFGLKNPTGKYKNIWNGVRFRIREKISGFCAAAKQPRGIFKKLKAAAMHAPRAAAELIRGAALRLRALEKEQKSLLIRQAAAMAVTVFIAAGSVATVMASTKWASIVYDGVTKPSVEITSNSTSDILKQAGITVGANDLVTRENSPSGGITVTVKSSRKVTISADGKQYTVLMHFGNTAADALAQTGVTLRAQDEVTPSLSAPVLNGMNISVIRKFHVSITADGKTLQALVQEGTVSSALQQTGVTLSANDGTDVSSDTAVTENMKINVARVTYQDVSSTQAIAYKTVTQRDAALAAGKKKVAVAGRNGSKTVVTRQKLCNGKVIESTVLSTNVTQQPVSQVTLIGTRRSYNGAAVLADGTLIDQNGNTVSYRKVITGRCSAYTGGGTTSTGRRAAFGLVAVNPRLIPYGTRLYICSPNGRVVYGYAIAADTGGAAMSGAIIADLYYDTYSQCMKIGSRTMNVYVLN